MRNFKFKQSRFILAQTVFVQALLVQVVLVQALLVADLKAAPRQEPPKGFMWYREELVQKQERPKEEKAKEVLVKTPKERNEALKKKLEAAVDLLLDQPTLKNAIAAQRMQKQVFSRCEDVSKAWVLAALMDAGLMTADMNPNILHREVAAEKERNTMEQKLKIIAQDWGLFFFVQNNCPFCEKFVPILLNLQEETKLQILAVSREGGPYGPFKGQSDTHLMQQLNPQNEAPMVFLVNRDGKRIYPVARGLVQEQKLKENILKMAKFDQERQNRTQGAGQ